LRKNGAVVAGAGADMDDMRPLREAELIVEEGPEARLPIVEMVRLVERDQRVMIDMARIGILRRPILPQAHRAADLPRPPPDEALARHAGKRLDDAARPQPHNDPHPLGKPPPSLLH